MGGRMCWVLGGIRSWVLCIIRPQLTWGVATIHWPLYSSQVVGFQKGSLFCYNIRVTGVTFALSTALPSKSCVYVCDRIWSQITLNGMTVPGSLPHAVKCFRKGIILCIWCALIRVWGNPSGPFLPAGRDYFPPSLCNINSLAWTLN